MTKDFIVPKVANLIQGRESSALSLKKHNELLDSENQSDRSYH